MRTMAGRAIHLSFQHRMVMRPVEFHFFVRMALETRCHILFGIQDVSFSAAGIYVKTGRAVAHFARLNFHSLAGDAHPRMSRRLKFFNRFIMAGAAAFRTDVFGAFQEFHLMGREAFVFRG